MPGRKRLETLAQFAYSSCAPQHTKSVLRPVPAWRGPALLLGGVAAGANVSFRQTRDVSPQAFARD